MATLNTGAMTLLDIAKKMDPNLKDVANVVEVLAQQNDFMRILPFMEGNLPTGNRTTLRSGLPTVGTRRINQGIAPSKSSTKQIDEGTMLLEGWAEVDVEAIRLGGNEAQLRAQEDISMLESMNQFFATNFFYGNTTQYIDRFHGLAPRYSSLSGDYANQILSAGGSGSDNTSIWLVGLGERGLHGIYPKGTNAGIERKDMGEITITENSLRRVVKATRHVWHSGIAIKDYRHVIRIANIDVSNLATFGSGSDTSAKLLRLLIQAANRIPGNPTGYGLRYAFLMNKTAKTWCDIMQVEKSNMGFGSVKDAQGMEFDAFRKIPIITCEAITDAESAVS